MVPVAVDEEHTRTKGDNGAVRRSVLPKVAGRLHQVEQKAARLVHEICDPLLGGQVKVVVHSRLTANAASGATRITLKKGARFSPRQVRALAHHEGLWHVLTSLNGYRQPVLTVLGVGLARHTESQEGGGIVAEYLTGNITD